MNAHFLIVLQATRRTGWVRRGVKHPESIADHMYRMATMSMLIDSQTGLAKDKLVSSRFRDVNIEFLANRFLVVENRFQTIFWFY